MDKDSLKAWIQASRPPFYIATFIPLSIGFVLAGMHNEWQPMRFLIVNVGALCVHLATNLANDYFDHLQGVDSGESIGGSRVIQEGKISLHALLAAIILFYFSAGLIAVYLTSSLHIWKLWILILFALFSSVFYVTPPIRYGYHGLGELFVGVNMGPVMVLGSYWVMTGTPGWEPVWISIPVGLMVAAILYYQNLPDMKTDELSGKRTLAVRLGKIWAYRGMIILGGGIYISIFSLYIMNMLSRLSLISIITIPIFVKVLQLIKSRKNWVELDQYGKYMRMIYLINGVIIIIAILF